MNTLQDMLNEKLKTLNSKKEKQKKSNLTTEHQVQGVYYAKKLGCKKPSEFAVIIKFYKQNPDLVARSWSFVSDYPNAHDLMRLFFWKYWQLKKEGG